MRALHLVAIPQLTGAAEPALDLVRGLRGLGVEVDLRIDTLRPGNLAALLEGAGETVARDMLRLRRLLPRYDVVYAHLSHDHALAALALGSRPRPVLVRTVHAARGIAPGFGRRWVLNKARGITVASERHRQQLAETHQIDPARAGVAGLGGCESFSS